MQYKKLNANGTKWINCEFDPTKKQIQLYKKKDGVMVADAIGLY